MVRSESWLDRDPDDLERLLIERGRRDRPSPSARRRTLASVTVAAAAGASLAATATSAAAAAATSALPWLVTAKWVAVGIAAGAVTLGLAEGVQHRPSVRTEVAHPVVVASPAAPSALPARAVEAPAPVETVETAIVPVAEVPVAPRAARPVAPRAEEPPRAVPEIPPPPPPSMATPEERSLEGEVRLLEEARRALDVQAAPRALTALDRYAQQFPAGRMGIEASAMRIETLVALGRRNEARMLARSFLANHSRSPAAMRVARLLEAIESGATP